MARLTDLELEGRLRGNSLRFLLPQSVLERLSLLVVIFLLHCVVAQPTSMLFAELRIDMGLPKPVPRKGVFVHAHGPPNLIALLSQRSKVVHEPRRRIAATDGLTLGR